MRSPRSVVLIVGLSLLPIAGGASAQADRVTGFAFLRMDPSARGAALAGSLGAMYDDDVNAFYYNPALLNGRMSGAVSLSYLNHLADINAGFLSYARDFEGVATVAAGVRFLSWGSFERANEFGERDGTFSASDVALTVGAARAYNERLRYGVNLHVIYSSIESFNASAIAIDVGGAYVVPESDFVASVTISNAGVTLSSFGETSDDLPFDVRLAVSKRLAHLPLTVTVTAFDLQNLGDPPADASGVSSLFQYITMAGELHFGPAFRMRIGYNHRKHESLRQKSRLDFAGLGIGAGIMVRNIRFDYAYNSWSSLGGLNQLTIGTTL